MRPLRVIRIAAATGNYFSLGCLLPIVFLGALLGNLHILFGEMGWPLWIIWVVFILFIIGFDVLFFLTYVVAVVAGFFYTGVWSWSLLAIGTVVAFYLIYWVLLLFGAVVAPKDEPEIPSWAEDYDETQTSLEEDDEPKPKAKRIISEEAYKKAIEHFTKDKNGERGMT